MTRLWPLARAYGLDVLIAIVAELYISDTTVKTHFTHILQKLGLRDRVQAVVLAYQTGVLETDAL
jgi:DNA-binding NarL/FixJ family response regulator